MSNSGGDECLTRKLTCKAIFGKHVVNQALTTEIVYKYAMQDDTLDISSCGTSELFYK